MSTQKPDLTRVWAGTAPSVNIEDPDVTSPNKYSEGWAIEVPSHQNLNYLQKNFSQGLAHINEQGIAVWDTETSYPINGYAKGSDGVVYVSLITNNQGNDPVSDNTDWITLYELYSNNLYFATVEQQTKYTMTPNRQVFGEEYLWGFHKQVFDSNNTNANKFIWSGDSTTAGDNAGGYTPSLIGSTISTELGLAKHQHVNSGHSGKAATDWDSVYVGQDIVNHPDMNVYVARWGINDGFWHNNVSTYIAAMDSALTNLRIFKGVEDLAIVVVAPNSTYDDPNNRGTDWYESIIPELRKICRKHMCVFVDIYSIWQDAKQGAYNTGDTATGKRWLDNPFGDGRGIHPDAAFACQIGLRITEMIVKPALVKANSRYNSVLNNDPSQINPSHNVFAANYPRYLGGYDVLQADGWPFDGKLFTFRNGTKIRQELIITEDDGVTEVGSTIPKRKIMRFGDSTTGGYSKWYNRAVAPGLVGGWTTYNSRTQKYIHREDGSCSLEGAVQSGLDNTAIFSLPEEMRPVVEKGFVTQSSAGFFGLVIIQTDGTVIASKNGGSFCGLDGVVWTAGD